MNSNLEKLKEMNRRTQSIDLTPIVNCLEDLNMKIDRLSEQNRDKLTERMELLSEQVGKAQERIYNTTEQKLRKIYIKILQIAGAATIAMILISVLLSVCLSLLRMFRM